MKLQVIVDQPEQLASAEPQPGTSQPSADTDATAASTSSPEEEA